METSKQTNKNLLYYQDTIQGLHRRDKLQRRDKFQTFISQEWILDCLTHIDLYRKHFTTFVIQKLMRRFNKVKEMNN